MKTGFLTLLMAASLAAVTAALEAQFERDRTQDLGDLGLLGEAGAERGEEQPPPTNQCKGGQWCKCQTLDATGRYSPTKHPAITAPATDAARQWQGWGTALKPAWEPVILARKPLTGTVAGNVLKHGTGAINIDGCRVHGGSSAGGSVSGANAFGQDSGWNEHENRPTEIDRSMTAGRWPPNVLLTHDQHCKRSGSREERRNVPTMPVQAGPGHATIGARLGAQSTTSVTESIEAWECVQGCPVAALDAQSGERPGMASGGEGARDASMFGVGGVTKPETVRGDTGTASRFFPQFQAGAADVPFYYTAKASTAERTVGLDERSVHPTMKPVALFAYQMLNSCPADGLVLDPFGGSGTTLMAAEQNHRRARLVELDPRYCDVIVKRWENFTGRIATRAEA